MGKRPFFRPLRADRINDVNPRVPQSLHPGCLSDFGVSFAMEHEEARSAEKIIAWAVRPRETSPYRSSAEGAANLRTVQAREIACQTVQVGSICRYCSRQKSNHFRRAFSAIRPLFHIPWA